MNLLEVLLRKQIHGEKNYWMLACMDKIYGIRKQVRIIGGFKIHRKCTASISCVDASLAVTTANNRCSMIELH